MEHSNTDLLIVARTKFGFKAPPLNFLRKVSMHNGVGFKSALPPLHSKTTIDDARKEAELVMFQTVQQLFDKININPSQIDVLVTNCSAFSPTPSLSSMIVNKFKMRSDINSFSLGGMGCSTSPIGADLICNFLQDSKLSYGLLVSTENIT
jgi:3-ketoacyl-CoA synthase